MDYSPVRYKLSYYSVLLPIQNIYPPLPDIKPQHSCLSDPPIFPWFISFSANVLLTSYLFHLGQCLYNDSNQVIIAKCYLLTKHSSGNTRIWETAYQEYITTYSLFNIINKHVSTTIPPSYSTCDTYSYKALLLRG